DNITMLGWRVGYVFLLVGAVHLTMLATNFGISKFIRLSKPATASFTIHTSQKTLTVSAFVWETYFAAQFPLALIPVIAHHITQMVADTIVAERMRLSTDRDAGPAAGTDG
ncbi:MAG: bile acid:sodium symporter, partial [Planctomycetes bacterium]|nr:bile acid:sodium symporter [Planctomycetota bacterium]